MKISTSLCLAPVLALVLGTAHGAPTAPAVRTEILSLLQRLQDSGCEFNRNGSWYSGAEARGHLLKKLDYLESHDAALKRSEDFIQQAATSSSMSGKPYLVRCAAAAPVESKVWLTQELTKLRGGKT
ncbi:DUF5329 domain-containing protein [Pelomonas sp. APW6]|uniref:DUF5329 domain-containing protein n=1 Tax=Roseateles subflavus TaxID=3053353 RepID=A0ABT7LCJ0_9BURK|nr:DUF5329 domain-containing protein [Pelomonas sp. APW6]MDL5030572.1 DUF5329 domain-containing protein [Pelomonas sp. APW6]